MPVVLLKSAPAPVAVFSFAVLARSAPAPTAVLNLPSVLLLSENRPTAVLYVPVVRLKSAFCPSAVLPPGYPPSGAGLTPCAPGKSPKQASTTGMMRMDNFVFIGLIAFVLRSVLSIFIFLSFRVIFDLLSCGVARAVGPDHLQVIHAGIGLRIVASQVRSRFACLQLRAHLLNLCGKSCHGGFQFFDFLKVLDNVLNPQTRPGRRMIAQLVIDIHPN